MNIIRATRRFPIIAIRKYSSNPPSVSMPTVIYNGKKYTRMPIPMSISSYWVLFPYKWAWEYSESWRWFCYSIVMCAPLFLWINKKVNSPEAKAAWAAKKKADFEKEHKLHMEKLNK